MVVKWQYTTANYNYFDITSHNSINSFENCNKSISLPTIQIINNVNGGKHNTQQNFITLNL